MKLFVANINFELDEGDLWQLFAPFGELEDVHLATDRVKGCSRGPLHSRGFGFVTFKNAGDARGAIEALDGMEVRGRALDVSEARSMARAR